MGVTLVIENERNGKVIQRIVKDDDLCLSSLAGFWHNMIKGNDGEESFVLDETTGASKGVVMQGATYYMLPVLSSIKIGTGTTAPAYANYKLETEVYTDNVEAVGYSVSSMELNTTLVATFNIVNTHAITEAGMTMSIKQFVTTEFMIFRDVFSAINVISGDIVTVKYIITFN